MPTKYPRLEQCRLVDYVNWQSLKCMLPLSWTGSKMCFPKSRNLWNVQAISPRLMHANVERLNVPRATWCDRRNGKPDDKSCKLGVSKSHNQTLLASVVYVFENIETTYWLHWESIGYIISLRKPSIFQVMWIPRILPLTHRLRYIAFVSPGLV